MSRARLLEGVVALGLAALVLASPGLRALLVGELRALGGGAASAMVLLGRDPGTLPSLALVLVKVLCLLLPLVRLFKRAPGRLAWLPLLAILFAGVLALAVPGVVGWRMWAVFGAATLLGWLAAARDIVRIFALLPWVVALEPLLGHSPLSEFAWPPSRIVRKCQTNDGVRPIDLQPELFVTRYFGITPGPPGWVLLSGERRSFWVRRDERGVARLGPPIELSGNFWQGCVRGKSAWVTKRGKICETRPPGDELPAIVRCHDVPGPPEAGTELDYVDILCPPDRPTLFVSQLLRGGLLEWNPETDQATFHPVVPGMNLQMVPRKDGKLVGITTSRLVVFDPKEDRVVESQPAGIVAMGIDLCPADGAVAVADFTGRLRLFERDGDGPYRLTGAVDVPAARRVAFAPGCDKIVVTSGDDRHAFLVDRATRAVVRSWSLGPGLRDIAFVDDHTVAAADACTIDFLDVR